MCVYITTLIQLTQLCYCWPLVLIRLQIGSPDTIFRQMGSPDTIFSRILNIGSTLEYQSCQQKVLNHSAHFMDEAQRSCSLSKVRQLINERTGKLITYVLALSHLSSTATCLDPFYLCCLRNIPFCPWERRGQLENSQGNQDDLSSSDLSIKFICVK